MSGRLRAVTQGEWIVLVAGVLLIVDLLVLPWHDAHFNAGEREAAALVGFDPTPTAVQGSGSGYGIAAVVLTAIMVGEIALSRLLSVRLPDPPVPWSQLQLIAGVFVAVILVIKLVRESELLGYGAYSAILAAVLVAYGGYAISQEAVRAG